MELTGKVTVVTGSASGLGRATVMQLVSNGASKGGLVGLTLPEEANLYTACLDHPNTLKVVALSGG